MAMELMLDVEVGGGGSTGRVEEVVVVGTLDGDEVVGEIDIEGAAVVASVETCNETDTRGRVSDVDRVEVDVEDCGVKEEKPTRLLS
jgi:hypothetical protein